MANLSRGVHEFEMDAQDNHLFILDLGERDRQGNRISTAFVESIVNQVISKRFVKTQQIQWTPEGARLLLQTQTRIPLLVTSMAHSMMGIRSYDRQPPAPQVCVILPSDISRSWFVKIP